MHIVQTAAHFTNATIVSNPELLQMLPEGIGDGIKQMLDNAYQYGREGISNMVGAMQTMINLQRSEICEFIRCGT